MSVDASLKEKAAPVVGCVGCWEAQRSFQVSGVAAALFFSASTLNERACSGLASVNANVSTVLV
jgi:hypothetical protein